MDRGQREGGAGDTMTWIEPNDQYDTQQTQACNSETDGDSSLDEFDSPGLFNNSATQKFPVDESLSDSCVYSERLFFFPSSVSTFILFEPFVLLLIVMFKLYLCLFYLLIVNQPWWAMIDVRADEYGEGALIHCQGESW